MGACSEQSTLLLTVYQEQIGYHVRVKGVEVGGFSTPIGLLKKS